MFSLFFGYILFLILHPIHSSPFNVLPINFLRIICKRLSDTDQRKIVPKQGFFLYKKVPLRGENQDIAHLVIKKSEYI